MPSFCVSSSCSPPANLLANESRALPSARMAGCDLTLVVDPLGSLHVVRYFGEHWIVQVRTALAQHVLRQPLGAVDHKKEFFLVVVGFECIQALAGVENRSPVVFGHYQNVVARSRVAIARSSSKFLGKSTTVNRNSCFAVSGFPAPEQRKCRRYLPIPAALQGCSACRRTWVIRFRRYVASKFV